MAWSPPAHQRRSWLVEQAGDYATNRFHHLRDTTNGGKLRVSQGGKGVRVMFSKDADMALWKARSEQAAKRQKVAAE